MPVKAYLEAGQVVGTHGVRGELRVQPWCDSPGVLGGLRTLYWQEGGDPVPVRSRVHKNVVLMKVEGVDTVQDAAALRGRVLYLDRRDLKLPGGTLFHPGSHRVEGGGCGYRGGVRRAVPGEPLPGPTMSTMCAHPSGRC